jgi:hypothetical protein
MSVNVASMTPTQLTSVGRPPGLLLNHVAAKYVLASRSQKWLSDSSGVSTAHLSEMMKGTKAATRDVADKIAEALEVDAAILFPELVEFRVHVRHFTAPGVETAVAA